MSVEATRNVEMGESISYEEFKGDCLGRNYCIHKTPEGEYFFDYAVPPEGFEFEDIKFFRISADSLAEIEAELKRLLGATNNNTSTAPVNENNNENENGGSEDNALSLPVTRTSNNSRSTFTNTSETESRRPTAAASSSAFGLGVRNLSAASGLSAPEFLFGGPREDNETGSSSAAEGRLRGLVPPPRPSAAAVSRDVAGVVTSALTGAAPSSSAAALVTRRGGKQRTRKNRNQNH